MASNSSSLRQMPSKMVVEVSPADDGTGVVVVPAPDLTYVGGEVEWDYFEIKRDRVVQIAMITENVWNRLNVSGEVETSKLEESKMYEVVFVVMLSDSATKWDVPLKFTVEIPGGGGWEPVKQERTEKLVSKPKQQWMEILAGDFKRALIMEYRGSINFSLDVASFPVPESGLFIQSVIFRPVSTPLEPRAIQPFEINTRELSIYRGQLKDYWTWDVIPDPKRRNAFFEVVRLVEIGWLEVKGKYDASTLRDGTTYEVVFLIRLNSHQQGWKDNEVTTQVNDQVASQKIDPQKYRTRYAYEFKEFILGDITVDLPTQTRGIEFSVRETASGRSKKGLVIRKVLLRELLK